MHKILFTGSAFFGQRAENLNLPNFEIIRKPADLTEDQLIEALEGVEGYILGGDEVATRKVIESSKNLKVIAFAGAGYESFIDAKAATEKGIVVTNTPGANAQTVAELTADFILTAAKKIIPMNEDAKKGVWGKRRMSDLKGKTLGIIGVGNIGTKVAKIMKNGFDMNILYFNRSDKPEFEKMFDAKKVSLEELFSQSDVVTIHIPLTSETEGMITEKELNLMKPTAILVNAARAKIVDGNALYDALSNNKLATAVFDVYYEEPFPKPENDTYKLISLPDDKFILTPHNGANSEEAYDAMTDMAVEDVVSVIEGRNPKYKVN